MNVTWGWTFLQPFFLSLRPFLKGGGGGGGGGLQLALDETWVSPHPQLVSTKYSPIASTRRMSEPVTM